jgi:hypothetical protein
MNRAESLYRNRPLLLILLIAVALFVGCATPPEPAEEPPPEPARPEPEPPPEPEPKGTAPLLGTTWELLNQYAAEDIPNPPEGTVRFRFADTGEPVVQVEGPVNRITGGYSYAVKRTKSESPYYEEGSLSLFGLERTRKTGGYIRYEDLMVSNMELVQGYYINGEHPLESRLTIFGGYGREEIILFVLEAVELP